MIGASLISLIALIVWLASRSSFNEFDKMLN